MLTHTQAEVLRTIQRIESRCFGPPYIAQLHRKLKWKKTLMNLGAMIHRLEKLKYLERQIDGRKTYVSITEKGAEALNKVFNFYDSLQQR